MNKIHFVLRKAARQTLAKIYPGPRIANNHIAVSGLPRSGTSWVAKALSLARGVSYYFEPDHILGPSYMHTYVPHDEFRNDFYAHIQGSLRGEVTDEYTLAEQGLREILLRPFARTVLIKWVWLTLSLNWIAEHFPKLTIVQIIRHPVPQFLSWRQRGWDPGSSLNLLLNQPALMNGPLKPYASVMQKASTFWEKTGAFWGAVSFMQLQAHRSGWFLLEHEWFCLDANTRFRWLVEKLGLQWNKEIEEFLSPERKVISGPGYGKKRDPQSEVHKWKSQVSQKELDELMETIAHFDLPFYRNLDPEALSADTLHKGLNIPGNHLP